MTDVRTLRIGELAARSGVSIDTLRYYDRLGVLRPTGRTEGRFRLYAPDSVARVRFVKHARRHGLTLAQVRELLDLGGRPGRAQCLRMRDALAASIADVEQRLVQLAAFRELLASNLSTCERALAEPLGTTCPVIVALEREDP